MTDSPPPAAPSARPPYVKDIPENNWLYRRLYSFGIVIAMAWLAFYVISKLNDAMALKFVALAALGVIVIQSFLYFCGASAEEFMKLASIVRNNRVILTQGQDKQTDQAQ